MLINKNVSVHTNKISLVPYSRHHVPKYHEWMKDPDIRAATASEQLTLDQEFAMQTSWRQDSDKLTFISCLPREGDKVNFENPDSMVGDVNLFMLANEEDSGEVSLVGELELMIAEKQHQGRGFGKASMLTFMRYILDHEEEIVNEYFSQSRDLPRTAKFAYLRIKVGETNMRSIKLFESLGFEKTDVAPNFFGEWEMRNPSLSTENVDELMQRSSVTGYEESSYPDEVDSQ